MHGNTPPHRHLDDDAEDDFPVGEDADDIEIIDDDDIMGYESDENGDPESASGMGEGAAIAVDQSLPDQSQSTFKGHQGAVFCCALDEKSIYAVSGGEDDKAYVWNVDTGEMHFECSGHHDSVTCVSFSHDSSYIASGDMAGTIKVWRTETCSPIWEFDGSDLRWLQWHPRANVLMAGTADGEAWMWRIPGKECKTFQSHGSPNNCGKIFPDGRRAVMGYDDGSVRIWDLKSAAVVQSLTDHTIHQQAVTVVDCSQDCSLVLTGSLDSTSKIINTSSGKVLATLQCDVKSQDDDSVNAVESVGFCSSLPLVATGTLKGSLAIWDIPTQVQRHHCKQAAGIVKLVWDRVEPLVYTASLDGIIRLWDGRSGQVETQWSGHGAEILDFALSQDGDVLLTSSEDGSCKVFKRNKSIHC